MTKCLIIPDKWHDNFPIEIENIRVELVEDANGNMVVTEDVIDWQKLENVFNKPAHKYFRGYVIHIWAWAKQEKAMGNLIDFNPKPVIE